MKTLGISMVQNSTIVEAKKLPLFQVQSVAIQGLLRKSIILKGNSSMISKAQSKSKYHRFFYRTSKRHCSFLLKKSGTQHLSDTARQ